MCGHLLIFCLVRCMTSPKMLRTHVVVGDIIEGRKGKLNTNSVV